MIGIEPLTVSRPTWSISLEQAVKLVRDVGSPAYKIYFDTFHGNIEEKSLPETIRTLGKGMLCHFHACENDRGIPGTGHQDWTGIRDALREVEYDGAAVIESFTPGTSRSRRRRRSGAAGAVAGRTGEARARFLRGLLRMTLTGNSKARRP